MCIERRESTELHHLSGRLIKEVGLNETKMWFQRDKKKWGRVMVFSNKTVSVFPEEWSSKHYKHHKEVNLQEETKLFL